MSKGNQAGMRNMTIARIFKTTLRLKGEKKAGLGGSAGGLYKRFAAPTAPPYAGFWRLNFKNHICALKSAAYSANRTLIASTRPGPITPVLFLPKASGKRSDLFF